MCVCIYLYTHVYIHIYICVCVCVLVLLVHAQASCVGCLPRDSRMLQANSDRKADYRELLKGAQEATLRLIDSSYIADLCLLAGDRSWVLVQKCRPWPK